MAEFVGRMLPVLKIGSSIPGQLKINDLQTWFLSLSNQALGIIFIGSVTGLCDWQVYQVMVMVAKPPHGAAL